MESVNGGRTFRRRPSVLRSSGLGILHLGMPIYDPRPSLVKNGGLQIRDVTVVLCDFHGVDSPSPGFFLVFLT